MDALSRTGSSSSFSRRVTISAATPTRRSKNSSLSFEVGGVFIVVTEER